jgi:hypothetical protein
MSLKKYFLCVTFLLGVYSCSLEREVDLGNGYFLLGDYENSVISKKNGEKQGVYQDILLGEIKNYEYNQKYIIVEREVNSKVKMLFQGHPLWKPQTGESIQFWIINKQTEELKGPLDSLSFQKAIKNEKIELNLNNLK